MTFMGLRSSNTCEHTFTHKHTHNKQHTLPVCTLPCELSTHTLVHTRSQEQARGLFLAGRLYVHTPSYNRHIHDCDEGTTPRVKTPIWTARRQPCSTSTCGSQKRAGRWTRKKRGDRKSSCLFSPCTRFCPGGKSLKCDCSS